MPDTSCVVLKSAMVDELLALRSLAAETFDLEL
jgi:hypothetical protein